MSVSRRSFLRAGAVVSAALVLKPSTFVFGNNSITSSNTANQEFGVQSYRREMFEPYVGDTFQVRIGKRMVDLKLVSLSNVKPASGITTGKTTRTDCFSMKFQAAKPLPVSATLHTLNHSKLGSFDLFMVQSKDGARILQTAIVNHLV